MKTIKIMKWMSYLRMAGLAAGTATVSAASAQVVNYSFTGETGGGVQMSLQVPDGNFSVPVGQFIMTSSTPGFTGGLLSYCTDVDEWQQSPWNYTVTKLSSAGGASPAWITGGGMNAATLWYYDKNGATTAIQTAGLQLAIWELLYNPVAASYTASMLENPANQGFYVTSTDAGSIAAVNAAVADLNGLSSLTTVSNQVEWLAPTEPDGSIGGSQGMFMDTPSSVPDTSSTLGLFSLALMALAARFASRND